MIGIVVVSHSPMLAEAAVDLALQMVAGDPPPIRIAAGVDGALGTDAAAVAVAIDELATASGVLVVPDLGSAVLSAELAIDLASATDVVVSDGPFVEGLTAGVVLAAAGGSLAEVAAEVSDALAGKREHLGDRKREPAWESLPDPRPEPGSDPGPDPSAPLVSAEATLVNGDGLHARPAALVVAVARSFDARVEVHDLTSGRGPAAAVSLVALIALGADRGHRIRITGRGPDAAEAVAALHDLAGRGFGDAPGAPRAPAVVGSESAAADSRTPS